jgi:hypothetical protein
VGTDGSTPVAGSFSFTYNGSATLPTNAGTYSVIALFTSADAGYVDGAADGTLVIYTATPTVQANGGGTFTYNGQPHSISATALGVDGVTPVAGTFSYTYNGLSTAPTTWGTYTAVAAFTPTDPNYSSSTASTTITIPDPRIVTGVSVTGVSTTSLKVSWNPVIEPTGATPTYTVYEQLWHNGTHSPKGSGGTPGYYYYTQVGSNISGSSLTISGLATANGYSGSHTYTVVSVDNSTTPATVSAYSALGTGSPEFAPSVPDTLLGGALVSQASVEIGHSVQISPLYYGNPSPTFTLSGAPSSM